MINTLITDNATKITADVVRKETCKCQALVVSSVPYREFENELLFFSNDEEGTDMSVDAGFSGTPEKIHDGIDSVLWTATDIIGGGKTTFNSTDFAHTGTHSIKADNVPVGDVYQLGKGSGVTMSNYKALTAWVYVDKDWLLLDSVSIYGWDNVVNQQVGLTVLLEDYFSYGSYDVWHKIVIPLGDFGDLAESTIVDAFRIRQVAASGKAPKYYLDDVQLEETGEPVTYTIRPSNGTWLLVYEFKFSFASLGDGALSYDKILNTTLISGLAYKREINGVVIFTSTIISLIDLLQIAGTEISSTGNDGTNMWVTVRATHSEPLVLKSEDEDKLSFTVTDDMSGLLHFKISAACRLERRQYDPR